MNEENKQNFVLLIGVEFKPAGKIYTFSTDLEDLEQDEPVLVETDGSPSIGYVVKKPQKTLITDSLKNVRRVLNRASSDDLAAAKEKKDEALKFLSIATEKVKEYSLPIKMLDADLIDGGSKVLFTFYAEERVDFRSLVKDLAGTLKKRIEMRQVGSRDSAKITGCFGPCGCTTCCSTYLRDFQPISISMAKNQGLSPNPVKLTGMCNKLKCCLSYENEGYGCMREGMPKIGKSVQTKHGRGRVIYLNILKREFTVKMDDESGQELNLKPEDIIIEPKVPNDRKRNDNRPPKKEGNKQ